MPKIILLRGNSGSGKSTIAKQLQQEIGPGTMLIPQDVVRREIMYVKDRPHNKAIDLLHTMVDFAFAHCNMVILEGILYSKSYQGLFDHIQHRYTPHIYAYYFDLPFEETLRRHQQKPVATAFGEAELRQWWAEKDYLVNIPEKMLDQHMSKAHIVQLILNDINGGVKNGGR